MSDLTLAELSDIDAVTSRLGRRGFSAAAARAKARRLADCAAAMRRWSPDAAVAAYLVPGRIEVLGKHTDYAGGCSLTAATEQGFCLLAAPRGEAVVRLLDAASGEEVSFEIASGPPTEAPRWSTYAATVARRLARNFGPDFLGADIVFSSDLPPAAGMSSSSALVTGIFLALSDRNRLAERDAYRREIDGDEALADYVAAVENGMGFGSLAGDCGVGSLGGSEDHTAILCSRPGRLSLYAYRPTRFERAVALPDRYRFVIAVSGVKAEKTGAARDMYNRLSRLADAATQAWNARTGRADPHLGAAIASADDGRERVRSVLAAEGQDGFTADELVQRFDAFAAENERIIPAAVEALAGGNMIDFGALVERSQRLAARRLGNQTPETNFLAFAARHFGATAASAFGAGFGGAVWALVAQSRVEAFSRLWGGAYSRTFGEVSGFAVLATRPGPPAMRLGTDAADDC